MSEKDPFYGEEEERNLLIFQYKTQIKLLSDKVKLLEKQIERMKKFNESKGE